jgi:serine/threonine-protein phosphatase 2A activator
MQNICAIVDLLDELDGWVDDIPPQPTPQRYGNLAFRVWGKRLEEVGASLALQLCCFLLTVQRAPSLLIKLLPKSHHRLIPFLTPYLATSFGSFIRMDYGTGHETSFALFLLCLTLARFLHPNTIEERDIVFVVFLRYLRLCWRLQDVYRLEPAGSHGVWGLDDSHFLPFIFGSAQLKGESDSHVLKHPTIIPRNRHQHTR